MILLLLAFLPALGLVLYTVSEQQRRTTRQVEDQAMQLAEAVLLQQQQLIEGARQLLMALAQRPDVRQRDAQACSTYFARLLAQYPHYANLGAVGRDGLLFCSAVPVSGPVSYAAAPSVRRALDGGSFTVGEYEVDPIVEPDTLSFGYPIPDDQGTVHGVVFAALDLDWLNRVVAETRRPPGSTLTIVDRNGIVVARAPDPDHWVGEPTPEGAAMQAVLARGRRAVVGSDREGTERLFAFCPMIFAQDRTVCVSIATPTAIAFGEGYRMLGWHLVGLALAGTLAFGAVWVGGGQYIVRPVTALVRTAKRLATGDLTARTSAPHDQGELGHLARAFDQMAEALEVRETALREAETRYRTLYEEAQQAYGQLARTQEQLVQAQKMEAIGRLAGGVAHDFNNLLTVIEGRSELMLHRLGPDDALRRDVGQIKKTADRAATLTRQLLAFSRKQVLQPRALDLNAVVRELAPRLRRLIGEHIELVIVPPNGSGYVNADPAQLEQVVVNLVVNARDAMPSGGRLTIESAKVQLDESSTSQCPEVRPGAYVTLAVRDSGIGMDADTRAHIFEPFFTTKALGKGTGLGLATVYGIVKQHEGHIMVESEPDQGTTFTIYLPAAGVAEDPSTPAATAASAGCGSETILLVEDEPELGDLAAEILQARGYTVLQARHPGEALLIAERHTGTIHLLLTDVVMPQMSGRKLAERLAPSRPEMKVLYMSGYTDEALGRHGVLDARTAYLPKPFTPDALVSKVREVLMPVRDG